MRSVRLEELAMTDNNRDEKPLRAVAYIVRDGNEERQRAAA